LLGVLLAEGLQLVACGCRQVTSRDLIGQRRLRDVLANRRELVDRAVHPATWAVAERLTLAGLWAVALAAVTVTERTALTLRTVGERTALTLRTVALVAVAIAE